jgi:molybdenum cofactor cytidylyltransferase
MNKGPVVIVLAAGKGSRFRSSGHKLAQAIGATTVLGMTLAHVIESGLPMVVVTTTAFASEAARFVASRDVVVLSEGEAARGMAHSIAAGVAASADADGWIMLPADMPLVSAEALRAVKGELARHAVVYAQHRGQRGHPVGFAAELFSDLMQLSGDEGARRLIARYPACAVEIDDAGVLADIDTVDDLAAARQAVELVTGAAAPSPAPLIP